MLHFIGFGYSLMVKRHNSNMEMVSSILPVRILYQFFAFLLLSYHLLSLIEQVFILALLYSMTLFNAQISFKPIKIIY